MDSFDNFLNEISQPILGKGFEAVFKPFGEASLDLVQEFYDHATPYNLDKVFVRGFHIECSISTINNLFKFLAIE